jgi:hypothetical protein
MALRTSPFLSILLLATMAGATHAAELGEAEVRSHIGQALVADVELNLIEEPGTAVKVRLANPDVYRGANIAMPPVLASLNMTVMRRDGRQFLHLTSLKPVESRYLHLYLELVDGSQRSVRLVTLWLTPDPNPAPSPVPAPMPPAAVSVAKPQALPVARPVAALQAGEEYVEAPVAVGNSAPKAVPPARKPPVRKSAPAPLQAHDAHAEAPSCAPQAPSEHLNACVALGEKNAALRHDLGKLEDKVRVLQGAAKPVPAATIEAPPAAPVEHAPAAPVGHAPAPPAAPAAHPVEPAHAGKETVKQAPADAPKGAPRIHRKPKKVEAPEPESGLPWLAIGGGVAGLLAVVALVLALLRRRKRAPIGKIQEAHKPSRIPKLAEAGEAKPAFMAAVKARLMPGRGKTAASAAPATPAEAVPAEVVSRPE